jgi:nucleoporin NUP82
MKSEYDIRRPDDPTQTFTFLPQASSASSSKFTAIDPLSRYATSFAFTPYSPSTFDFSPLTVTVLIANGDVYTMNPILPLRAELLLSYLQGLKAYAKQRRRKAEDGRDGLGIDQADSWDIWIGNLIKQYREGNKVEDSPNRSSNRSSSLAPADRNSKEDSVKVHPPHLTSTGGPATGSHKALLRQGPVIFTPAPQEADEDEETYASDIAILKVPTQDGDDEEDTAREEVRVMSIAWSSSRVDIGLYTEVSEPVWVDNDVSSVLSVIGDANGQVPQQANPTIPILESVCLSDASSDEPVVAPSFVIDAVYADTVHVRHSQGLSSINTRPLLDSVLLGGNDDSGSSVSTLISTDG